MSTGRNRGTLYQTTTTTTKHPYNNTPHKKMIAMLVDVGFWSWMVASLLILIRLLSSEIYDLIIVKMTSVWYLEVLKRLPKNSKVVDIGIGTGTALMKNAQLVIDKNLTFVGVDYEPIYVAKCGKMMKTTFTNNKNSKVFCKSIYDADLKKEISIGGEDFDFAYFSGSISLMPNPVEALKCASQLIKKDGSIYITQTFQRRGTKLFEIVKPMLKFFTTIDFGKLTYEYEIDEILKQSKLRVVEKSIIKGSIDNYFQAAFIIELKLK